MVKILYCTGSTDGTGERLFWHLANIMGGKIVPHILHDAPFAQVPDDYDLGVSFLYTHKIPTEQIAAHPWINFHPGPLPEMRGRNLAYHAIMNGAAEFGATLHYMSAEFDTGDIIECRRFPIRDTYTAGDLVDISHGLLADMFKEYMPRFVAGEKIPGTPQTGGTYYRKEPIDDIVKIAASQEQRARALTVAGRYYARVVIGGMSYRLVPETEL